MKNHKSKRAKYFRRQKIHGAILVVLGVLSAILLEGDITAALLLVPFGLYIVFTKEALLIDDDYDEVKSQKNKNNRKEP